MLDNNRRNLQLIYKRAYFAGEHRPDKMPPPANPGKARLWMQVQRSRRSAKVELNDMKVVILCGGLGTRLREETEFRPKPMVLKSAVCPILWHIHEALRPLRFFVDFVLWSPDTCRQHDQGVLPGTNDAMNRDCTVQLGPNPEITYHGEHDGKRLFHVTLADTGQEAMTGDRMKQIAKYRSGGGLPPHLWRRSK